MCMARIEQGREEAHGNSHCYDKRCVLTNWHTYVLPRVISHVILQIYFALRVYLILSAVFLY